MVTQKRYKTQRHYLPKVSGVDSGLILGCCKTSQKKTECRNDVICRKIVDSAKSKKIQFWLQ